MGAKNLTVKISTKAFVQWDDPFNKNVKHCRFYVPIKKLPVGLPIEPVNTRPQNIKQKLYQNVVRTATHTPEIFHHNNNGLFVVVRNFKKVNSEFVELSFGPKDGIGDGAHSYLSCVEANKRTGGCEGYVSFYVVSKLDEKTLKKSCLSRNSSISNKTFTRYNYEGKFDFIKEQISNQIYADLVSYRENEGGKKKIAVRQLIALGSLFINADKSGYTPSILSYLNKTYTMDRYVDMMNGDDKNNSYLKLNGILSDIYFLYDYINLAMCKVHEEKTQKEGDLDYLYGKDFIKKAKVRAGTRFFFMNINNKTCANEAVVYPILAALKDQLVLDKKTGCFKWKRNLDSVIAIVDKKANKLYSTACSYVLKADKDLLVLGKNQEYWKACYSILSSK